MNFITFNPYEDAKIKDESQLVIYDLFNKKILTKIIIPPLDQYKIKHTYFEKHWEYKYKY